MTRRIPLAPDRRAVVAAIAVLVLAAVTVALRGASTTETFQYSIKAVHSTLPGQFPVVTFSVTNPATGASYDLQQDAAWTQTASGASRLFLQIGWDTRDFNNTGSGVRTGPALPIPVNILLSRTLVNNGDGTYTVTSPAPIPATASGSGEVAMEGHPAGQDATGAWTVRVPVRSVYKYFTITDATTIPRRAIVDPAKCRVCHRPDGTGVAPRLTVHGNNRTEETQVCVVCHNANNTDASYRLATLPAVVIGPYTFAEQSIDFKRLIHGIHASSKGFRRTPLVVAAFNYTLFDASQLAEYPADLKTCTNCHIDNGTRGTFEIPLATGVLGSTFETKSTLANPGASPPVTVVIDTDPTNDGKVSPIAATCSSCHDDRETILHMVQTGGAVFQTSRRLGTNTTVAERCPACHGPGKERSVRRVHLSGDH